MSNIEYTNVALAEGPHHPREARVKPKACDLYILREEAWDDLPLLGFSYKADPLHLGISD